MKYLIHSIGHFEIIVRGEAKFSAGAQLIDSALGVENVGDCCINER